nr:MAG TPA: hypothetical protein [Inoviridae sp.]
MIIPSIIPPISFYKVILAQNKIFYNKISLISAIFAL